MFLRSPCIGRCKRKNEDKKICEKKCPAVTEFIELSVIDYNQEDFDKMTERLDKLAEEYVKELKLDQKPKKRKYTKRKKKNKECPSDKKQINKMEQTVKQDSVNPDVIKLYMSKYPEIATYVFENAETFLLPARHVIMTLLAEAIIARKNANQ